ncbi:MAG: hypothetical protein AB1Z23_03595 [Eubacteriales bacterium]
MKKIIILGAAFLLIFAAACQKQPETFDMTSTKTVYTADRALSIELPDVIYKNKTTGVGKEYSSKGQVDTEDEKDVQFYFHVTRFFQAEDELFTYDLFKEFIEQTRAFIYTSKSKMTTLYEDYSFGEGATGVINKIEYGDLDYYSAHIKGDGAYYTVSLGVYAQLDEESVMEMLKSIRIDAQKEEKAVEKFELETEDGRYYSADFRDASIEMPENWKASEAMNIMYPNSILAMTGNGGSSAISVQVFDKSVSGLGSASETYEFLVQYMQARQLWDGENNIKAFEVETKDGIFTFYIYLSDYIVTQCVMENGSYIFVIEGIVFDGDVEKMDEVIDISATFYAQGVLK